MSLISDFEVGSVWMVTTECKRVAKVLSAGEVEVWIPSLVQNQPPTRDTRRIVTVQVCTPAKEVPGHVSKDEADQGLIHRLRCKDFFDYDMWEEDWIDTPRERVVLSPKPKQYENDWIRVVTVHKVRGRADVHEAVGSSGKLGPTRGKLDSGTTVEAVLIPPEDVHPQLFAELGEDEKTQTELDQIAHDNEVIENFKKQEAAKAKEARKGNAAECKTWGPNMKLKAQLRICGLTKPDKELGNFNDKARAMLATYLPTLGINPWDIMDLETAEFQVVIDDARKAMPQ